MGKGLTILLLSFSGIMAAFDKAIASNAYEGLINNITTKPEGQIFSLILGLVRYNGNTNEVALNRNFLIIFTFVILIFFIGAAIFFRGKRQRYLLRERNMMSALIDNIPDTIYFKDLDSKFTRINKSQAKLLGFENPDDAIGKSDFDFFEHAQEAYNTEQEIIRSGQPVINQVYKHLLNGQDIYLSDTKIPLMSTNGKCVGTVGITRNITNFKLAEDAMLEHQAKFKALFENAPLAIFRLDKDMYIVEANHRFKKMFGYSDADLENLTKSDLLVDPELGSLIIDTVMETKEVNTEIMLKRKDGQAFIANLTLALLEEGFKDVSIEGIVEDVTQVAKAREELIKAKDKAIEADQLKSLFLANMSHEIRTPMNAIIGFTNMLREDDLTSEDKNSFIDVIQSNGNSLMTLIDSIVDFSKLETEQMTVSFGEFNFKPLFDSAFDYASKMITSEQKNQSIKLIKTIPENPDIRIKSDRYRLNQVINHLINNAVKFTDQGEIELGYKFNEDKLEIFIRDTGVGINKNKQKVIFERFAKVNNDKNRLYGGTGIGLTISKGLMKLMKGRIKLDSAPGEGSTFTLELETEI
ncbi:MAG TPA: PAS domain S-box protein [Prolixibacteraceae bacterium]|nr:PAS domain S-box protein [Prolixibacteraceae bacterium]